MNLLLDPFTQQDFGITPKLKDKSLLIALSGTGDMAAVAPLRTYLSSVQSETSRLGLECVGIDVRAVYLLNSSCLKALVSFIYETQTCNAPFKIRFVVEPRLPWQRRSLAALQRMAPEIVSIEDP